METNLHAIPAAGAVAVFITCIMSAWIVSKRFVLAGEEKSIHSLDGLRGVLAILVFIHHSMLWHRWLHGGQWGLVEPSIFTNLGRRSVAIFFMITALLFLRKVASIGEGGEPWIRLAAGRIYRIVPLYLMQVLVMVAIVAWGTRQLNEPPGTVLVEFSSWFFFVIPGMPDLNRCQDTILITSGVAWSLAYEWLFYTSLPLVALALGRKVPGKVLMLSLAFVVTIALLLHPQVSTLLAFGGGVVCFVLEKFQRVRAFATTRAADVATTLCFVLTFCYYPAFLRPLPLLFASATFCLICMGNDMFGILRCRPLRVLGELSYGIYLFHGIFLYGLMKTGGTRGAGLGMTEYWLSIVMISPLLIAGCAVLNRVIERRAMRINPFARARNEAGG